jgi:hypothetical protein
MGQGIQINFRRPKYTHPVLGHPTVGLTGEGEAYVCEAEYAGEVGYGSGDTPAAARSQAAARLRARLDDPPCFAR